MTLHEGAQDKAIWAMRVLATFMIFGGFVGGGAIGIAIPIIAVATQWPPRLDVMWLFQLPFFALFTAFYGIVIGLPASVLTGAAYLLGRERLRWRWRLIVCGAAISALWGLVLADLLSWGGGSTDGYIAMAAIFAACGAVATLVCFWLLQHWDLHRPSQGHTTC